MGMKIQDSSMIANKNSSLHVLLELLFAKFFYYSLSCSLLLLVLVTWELF